MLAPIEGESVKKKKTHTVKWHTQTHERFVRGGKIAKHIAVTQAFEGTTRGVKMWPILHKIFNANIVNVCAAVLYLFFWEVGMGYFVFFFRC